jgi:coenzyme F420-0:L-glutamate ligase/coenzyme F420-1:gamma-L-glutamate ligase
VSIEIIAVEGVGEVESGTDLADLVVSHGSPQDGDVVVITSKIVSKALGLATTTPRDDVIAASTDRVVAARGATRIVRTHQGLTLAAAGVDASNVAPGVVLPLPPDPDGVARKIRADIHEGVGVRVAVVISDTAGRAWRVGQTDIAIGCAGLAPLESFAGRDDAYGNALMVTEPAVADEVAGAAELATGKLGQRPIAIIRGLDPRLLLDDDGPGAFALIRDEDGDMFGLGARDAVIAALDGHPVRGFSVLAEEEEGELDFVTLAAPGDLAVERNDDGYVISAPPDQQVEAGMLKQRLLSVAVAHGLEISVDVDVLGDY